MSAVDSPRRPVLLVALLLAAAIAPAAAQESTLVRLNDAVGDTIDRAERDSFHLFPNTVEFQHAVILARPGPEFFAKVTLAAVDTAKQVFYRIMPGDLHRIRFLVNNRECVAGQQESDTTVVHSLATFWQSIEQHPLQSMTGEPASESVAVSPQPVPTNFENRYNYALHGAALGSIAGGCIGSHAGISYVRTEEDGCLFPPSAVYHVDPCVFWGASCGITALGTGLGYALGERIDHEHTGEFTRLKEGTNWRTGLALGALIPGAALGYVTFWVVGISRYGVLQGLFDYIDNDPEGWTAFPMAFTSVCIAVESATIGYRIGRAMDRRKAEDAEARRRALGR